MRSGARFAAAAGLIAAAALAGCGSAPERPSAFPGTATGAACLGELSARQVGFEREADFRNGRGCGIETAISLRQSVAALNRPVQMSCGLALALNDFERAVVQPAAWARFGQPVVRLHHVGAYVCRGRSSDPGRLSEHAFGRAIDVIAFELADGTRIRVADHWLGAGARSAFLREVARGACRHFGVVLTPNHDRAHRDHFHLDVGRWALCGV
jgi:hypothetical protein